MRGKLIAAGVLVLLLVYVGAYFYSLANVKVQDLNVTGVERIGTDGYTLKGTLALQNNGIVRVGINKIDYAIALDANGQELARGAIPIGDLPAGETTAVPLEINISWSPTAQLTRQLLAGNTYATINGTVEVADLGFTKITAPVQTRIDLGPYMRQFVAESATTAITNIWNAVTAVVG